MMNELMDKIFSAKGALITAAIGERVVSTTGLKKPMVYEYEDYFEISDESGNEILLPKDYIEVDTVNHKDFVIKYGVIDYYITTI